MSSSPRPGIRILGSLRIDDGQGVVRMEDRFATGTGDVWSALTDPSRLGRWYGEITGDLRVGGEYRARVFASGWDGTGRIEACEPPHRLVVTGAEPGEPVPHVTEITLAAEGQHTVLVWEERGMPVALLAAYGAGVQIHVEDLGTHLAGQERGAPGVRWGELQATYDNLAANIS
jgi:uncharacterized protein YndB with AHSA1/START domain